MKAAFSTQKQLKSSNKLKHSIERADLLYYFSYRFMARALAIIALYTYRTTEDIRHKMCIILFWERPRLCVLSYSYALGSVGLINKIGCIISQAHSSSRMLGVCSEAHKPCFIKWCVD